ncbi:oxidoreductase [Allostella vacuolata]|nr:oxidoreductase [Stella vacuolata]
MADSHDRSPVAVRIIGDGFMDPSYFVAALEERVAARPLAIRSMALAWPLQGRVTKSDPTLPVQEFAGRPEDYFDFVADAEILVNHLAPVTRETLERAPGLRLIAVSRGGPVNVDLQAARERGVAVVNTPGRNASAVAEFTIASLLAETRNLIRGHVAMAAGGFPRDLYHRDIAGPELCEMTVGVVGYGEIGARVVALLKPFGGRILVADPYKDLSDADKADGVRRVALDELLRDSDAVTLHPRVTPETRGMIGRERIAAMRRGAYLVNTTRGQILDYAALYDALVSRHLAGAALDTFDPEPPPADWPLLRLPNVTLSPHIAGASRYSIRKAAVTVADDIERFLAGQPLRFPCVVP